MAKVGMAHARYTKIETRTDGSGKEIETYGEVKQFSKAIRANTSVNSAQADLYADDGLAETANEFIDGSITFEGDDIEDDAEIDVTGATAGEDGGLVNSSADVAPYLRFGFLIRRYKSNKSQYRGIIFPKLKFDPLPDDYETKGQTIVFKSISLTAKFLANALGQWRIKSKWMDTMAAADTWLDENLRPEAEEE